MKVCNQAWAASNCGFMCRLTVGLQYKNPYYLKTHPQTLQPTKEGADTENNYLNT